MEQAAGAEVKVAKQVQALEIREEPQVVGTYVGIPSVAVDVMVVYVAQKELAADNLPLKALKQLSALQPVRLLRSMSAALAKAEAVESMTRRIGRRILLQVI